MISFCGEYVCNLTTKQLQPNNQFTDKKATFVRLNPTNIEDIKALGKSISSWENHKFVASNIVQNMCMLLQMFESYGLSCDECSKFYVATLQEDTFEKLDDSKILGAIQTNKGSNKNRVIEFFEVNPKYSHNNPERTVKDIGHAIIDAIKKLYLQDDIELIPTHEAEKFYEKEGFVKAKNGFGKMVLKR